MLDPVYIRQNADYVKKVISGGRSKPEKADVDRWIGLDKERGELIQIADKLRSQRNELSANIQGKPDEETIQKVKGIKDEIEIIEKKIKSVEDEWQQILNWIPNIPISEEAMPFGKGEEENPIDRAWIPGSGYVYMKDKDQQQYTVETFPTNELMPAKSIHWDAELSEPKHHVEVGGDLKMFDIEQGAKVSGTRFKYLTNDGALLEFSLQQLVFQELLKKGFKYVVPPLMVKERSLYGSAHFPEQVDQVYKLEMSNFEESNQLYLLGSSEPTNFSLYMDKIIDEEELPIKIFAYTPCFRSEVGSWGKDVRGIKRVHQFAKIEMNCICHPDDSIKIFNELLSINEWLLQTLEIPYRLARKCTGDAGYHASAEQIDPEAWLPAQKEFMEVGTDTNTTDYQARRLNIKFKTKDGQKDFAHTVNDTGMPMERMIIAIIDNYQQSDGSIVVPKALRQFMGKEVIK